MGKFVIRTTEKGSRFVLKAGNGEVIAVSQMYASLDGCVNGVASVKNNAPEANVEDQTVEGFEKQPCPKFEVYVDKAGEYRFRLCASNGENIAASEGYVRKDSALNGIDSIRRNAPEAEVVEDLE